MQNGDRVNISTNPRGNPSRNWLRWVKTARARNRIRHWFNEQDRIHALKLGKKLLAKEIRRHGLDPQAYIQSPDLLEVATKLRLGTLDNLLVQIGNGKQFSPNIVKLLQPDGADPADENRETTAESIPAVQHESGIDVAMVRIMKCCTPIRGISIHKVTCFRLPNEPERLVHVEWKSTDQLTYLARISTESEDYPGMLGEIANAVAQCEVNIHGGSFGPGSGRKEVDGRAFNVLTLQVTGLEQLETVMGKIRQLAGVQRVKRESHLNRKT